MHLRQTRFERPLKSYAHFLMNADGSLDLILKEHVDAWRTMVSELKVSEGRVILVFTLRQLRQNAKSLIESREQATSSGRYEPSEEDIQEIRSVSYALNMVLKVGENFVPGLEVSGVN